MILPPLPVDEEEPVVEAALVILPNRPPLLKLREGSLSATSVGKYISRELSWRRHGEFFRVRINRVRSLAKATRHINESPTARACGLAMADPSRVISINLSARVFRSLLSEQAVSQELAPEPPSLGLTQIEQPL